MAALLRDSRQHDREAKLLAQAPVAQAGLDAAQAHGERGLEVEELLLIHVVAAQQAERVLADRGNAAAYFSFPDLKNLEAHVSEIPPASATATHRHSCEALFYVLSGSGYSRFRVEGQQEQRIAWEAGDLFCTPIHVWHQHVNSDSEHPARYLEITTIPLMKSVGDWRIEGDPEDSVFGR